MAKKKRQGEPPHNDSSDDSTDSTGDVRHHPKCIHIKKAVNLSGVQKTMQKAARLSTECELCKTCPPAAAAGSLDYAEVDNSLWMCLRCGHQACGRYKNEHALHHYHTPHSDSHSICLNTSSWAVWCYDCNDEVHVRSEKRLLECVEYVKKFAEGGRKQQQLDTAANNVKDHMGVLIEPLLPVIAMHNRSEFVARGLTNLGNTCFFNSVMQCLGQTPYLLKLLEDTARQGQQFKLPGGKVLLDEKQKKSQDVPPLEGELEEWKPLTRVLAETLKELQSGRREVHNPRPLFSALTERMTQFGGGDQHDSHELLRHLLDAVREEDLRRYQRVILHKLGFSTKTNPATVEGDQKRVLRFYKSQASELLPTEQVFRGVLVSTLECQDCGHKSHREEYFLDLSLSISEKQRMPVLRRKAEESQETHHQSKKERRQAKKAARKELNRGSPSSNSATSKSASVGERGNERPSPPIKSDSESDADIEDNVEDSNNSRTTEEGTTKGTESGYNSDKNSPENAFPDISAEDNSAASPAVGMLSISPISPDSPATSPASSEANLDLESPSCGRNSPSEGCEDIKRPQSRMAFTRSKNNDLKADLEKLSLRNEVKKEPEGAYGGASFSDHNEKEVEEIKNEQMDIDIDDMYNGTISKANIEEGECSVLSCLNQFTTSELLTANNKVACESCTERRGGDKKTVYTNATMQLLIYNPPAVLILHLKRFQVCHFRPSKISKQVKFPKLLDIAPFCSKRSKNLPTFDQDRKEVLYSLYGVVEHNGSLHGGHYIAYVKVRSKIADDNYRWQFLPKNQRETFKRDVNDSNIPAGKWFYVSDSHAAEVPESKVLDAHAYLLFYERIL